MTNDGISHVHNEKVVEAARWLADQSEPPRPIVGSLRQRFDLTSAEACEACSMSQNMRMQRGAIG